MVLMRLEECLLIVPALVCLQTHPCSFFLVSCTFLLPCKQGNLYLNSRLAQHEIRNENCSLAASCAVGFRAWRCGSVRDLKGNERDRSYLQIQEDTDLKQDDYFKNQHVCVLILG